MARARAAASRSTAVESEYPFRAKLWRWQGGKASWYFFTLPARVSLEIRLVDAGPRRVGFGALRVEATVGRTTWKTSIFPSTKLDSYLLPVKVAVRRAEGLADGRMAAVRLVVRRAG
jgi:hypothetical protein